MDILRTPDERFADLPDWPFAPRYLDVDGLRVHHVDEGPRDAPPVLLLHGEPSWSYLYRHMIPPLAAAGHRVIAPDLVGFGRSDKPAGQADYTYDRHVGWMRALVEQLDLTDITLFGQDWGGLIGLRLVAAMGDRFARVVVANTGLPTGDRPLSEAWQHFRDWAATVEEFPVGFMLQSATTTDLPAEVIAAYDAPFPDESYKCGVRVFPSLVPSHPEHPDGPANRAAWERLAAWEKPFLTAFSDGDPITAGGERVFQHKVPGAQGRSHVTIEDAGHFLQEDAGPRLAEVIDRFIRTT